MICLRITIFDIRLPPRRISRVTNYAGGGGGGSNKTIWLIYRKANSLYIYNITLSEDLFKYFNESQGYKNIQHISFYTYLYQRF